MRKLPSEDRIILADVNGALQSEFPRVKLL